MEDENLSAAKQRRFKLRKNVRRLDDLYTQLRDTALPLVSELKSIAADTNTLLTGQTAEDARAAVDKSTKRRISNSRSVRVHLRQELKNMAEVLEILDRVFYKQ